MMMLCLVKFRSEKNFAGTTKLCSALIVVEFLSHDLSCYPIKRK